MRSKKREVPSISITLYCTLHQQANARTWFFQTNALLIFHDPIFFLLYVVVCIVKTYKKDLEIQKLSFEEL